MSRHRRSLNRSHFTKGDDVVFAGHRGVVTRLRTAPPRAFSGGVIHSPYSRFDRATTQAWVEFDRGFIGRSRRRAGWIAVERLRHAPMPGDKL